MPIDNLTCLWYFDVYSYRNRWVFRCRGLIIRSVYNYNLSIPSLSKREFLSFFSCSSGTDVRLPVFFVLPAKERTGVRLYGDFSNAEKSLKCPLNMTVEP